MTPTLDPDVWFPLRIMIFKDGKIYASGSPGVLSKDIVLAVYGVEAAFHNHHEKPFMIPLRAVQ
jgi:ABC-type cobalamin/Fe3+-siderophores transport system ATPase subunit